MASYTRAQLLEMYPPEVETQNVIESDTQPTQDIVPSTSYTREDLLRMFPVTPRPESARYELYNLNPEIYAESEGRVEEKDSGLIGALKLSTKNLLTFLRIDAAQLGRDPTPEELADLVHGHWQNQQEFQKSEQNKRLVETFQRKGMALDQAKGFADKSKALLSMVGSAIYSMATNPYGTLEFTTEQLAMSAPPIAAMFTGAWTGAKLMPIAHPYAKGAAGFVGGAIGLFLGDVAVETGAGVVEALHHRGVDVSDKNAVLKYLQDPNNIRELYKDGLVGGMMVGAVDVATFGLAKVIFSGPFKPVKNALIKRGVDMDDPVAIMAGLARKDMKPVVDKYITATTKGSKKTAATVLALETVGEGGGEALKQRVVRGEVASADVGLEMLGGFSQSAATTVLAKTLSSARKYGLKDSEIKKSVIREQIEALRKGESSGIDPATLNASAASAATRMGETFEDMEEDDSILAYETEIGGLGAATDPTSVVEGIEELAGYEGYSSALRDTLTEDYGEVIPLFVAMFPEEVEAVKAGEPLGRSVIGSLDSRGVQPVRGQSVVSIAVPIGNVISRGNISLLQLAVKSDNISLAKAEEIEVTPKEKPRTLLEVAAERRRKIAGEAEEEKIIEEFEAGRAKGLAERSLLKSAAKATAAARRLAEKVLRKLPSKESLVPDSKESRKLPALRLSQIIRSRRLPTGGAKRGQVTGGKVNSLEVVGNYRAALNRPDRIELVNKALRPMGYKLVRKNKALYFEPTSFGAEELSNSAVGSYRVQDLLIDDYFDLLESKIQETEQKRGRETAREKETAALERVSGRERARAAPTPKVAAIINELDSLYVTREPGERIEVTWESLRAAVDKISRDEKLSIKDRKSLNDFIKSLEAEYKIAEPAKPAVGRTITIGFFPANSMFDKLRALVGKKFTGFQRDAQAVTRSPAGKDTLLGKIAGIFVNQKQGIIRVAGQRNPIATLTLSPQSDRDDIAYVYALASMYIYMTDSVSLSISNPDLDIDADTTNIGAILKFPIKKTLGNRENLFVGELERAFGKKVGYTRVAPDKVIIFNTEMTRDEFAKTLGQFYGETKAKYGYTAELYSSSTQKITHNWVEDPSGKTIRDAIREAGFGNILPFLDNRRGAFLKVAKNYGVKVKTDETVDVVDMSPDRTGQMWPTEAHESYPEIVDNIEVDEGVPEASSLVRNQIEETLFDNPDFRGRNRNHWSGFSSQEQFHMLRALNDILNTGRIWNRVLTQEYIDGFMKYFGDGTSKSLAVYNQGLVGVFWKIIEDVTKNPLDIRAQRLLRQYLAHELWHHIDSLGSGDFYTNVSPRFDTGIDFAHAQTPDPNEPAGTFVLPDNIADLDETAYGDVLRESLEFWNNALDLLHKNIAEQLAVVKNEADVFRHKGNREIASLRHLLTYPLSNVQNPYYVDIKLELFAQLGSLYTLNPDIMSRHLPIAYKLFEDIVNELNSVETQSTDSALRKHLQVTSPPSGLPVQVTDSSDDTGGVGPLVERTRERMGQVVERGRTEERETTGEEAEPPTAEIIPLKPATRGLFAKRIREALVKDFSEEGIARLEKEGILTIVDGIDDLPAEEAAEARKIGAVYGMYDKKNDKGYLFANRLTPRNAKQYLLHEIGVHHSLHNILTPKEYARLITDVLGSRETPEFKPFFEDIRRDYNYREDSIEFIEEVIAAMVQHDKASTFPLIEKVILAIRRFIRNIFPGVTKLTRRDIQYVVRGSINKSLMSGKRNQYYDRRLNLVPAKGGIKGNELAGRRGNFPNDPIPFDPTKHHVKPEWISDELEWGERQALAKEINKAVDAVRETAASQGKKLNLHWIGLNKEGNSYYIDVMNTQFGQLRIRISTHNMGADYAPTIVPYINYYNSKVNTDHLTKALKMLANLEFDSIAADGTENFTHHASFWLKHRFGDPPGERIFSEDLLNKYPTRDWRSYLKKLILSKDSREKMLAALMINAEREALLDNLVTSTNTIYGTVKNVEQLDQFVRNNWPEDSNFQAALLSPDAHSHDGLSDEEIAIMDKAVGGKKRRTLWDRIDIFQKEKWLKFTAGAIDQYRPIARKLGNDGGRAWMMMHLSDNAHGMLHALLHFGMPQESFRGGEFDWYTLDKTGEGFIQIMSDLDGEVDRFLSWMMGNRAKKLSKPTKEFPEGREQFFTPDEIDRLTKLNKGQISGKSRALLYAKTMRKLSNIQARVLDIATNADVISDEQRSVLETDFYVPFYREFEAGDKDLIRGPSVSGDFVNIKNVIHKLHGSELKVHDVMHNMLMNWHALMNASLKNRGGTAGIKAAADMGIAVNLMSKFKDLIKAEHPDWADARVEGMAKKMVGQVAFGKRKEKGTDFANYVYILKNGEKEWYEVNDPLVLNSLLSLNWGGTDGKLIRTFSGFKRAFTIGVTANPIFKVRNLIRDTLHSVAVGQGSVNIFGNVTKGLKTAKLGNPIYADMLISGGAFSFGFLNDDPTAIRRLIAAGVKESEVLDTNKKIMGFLQKGWNWWGDVGNRMENANRAALYMKRRDEVGHMQASFESRDLLNFSSHGRWIGAQYLMSMMPFMNARLQGIDKMARSARYKEQRPRFLAVVSTIVLSSILYSLAMGDDEDYKALPDWVKDTYWPIKLPGGRWFYLPKPFEIGAIASMGERVTQYIANSLSESDAHIDAEYTTRRIFEILMDQLAFDYRPQFIRPIVEVIGNYDSFMDRRIESLSWQMNKTPDYLRKHAQSSDVAVTMSEWSDKALRPLLGHKTSRVTLSPVQIDHLIEGYFGWLGAVTISATDNMFSAGVDIAKVAGVPLEDSPPEPTKRLDEMAWVGPLPIAIKSFISESPAKNNKFVELWYDQLEEIHEVKSMYDAYKRDGLYDEAREVLVKNGELLAWRKSYDKMTRFMSKLGKQKRLIENDMNMTPDEKRMALDKLITMRTTAITDLYRFRERIESEAGPPVEVEQKFEIPEITVPKLNIPTLAP